MKEFFVFDVTNRTPLEVQDMCKHAVAPLLEKLERYDLVEQAAKKANEVLLQENARLREALQFISKAEGSADKVSCLQMISWCARTAKEALG